MTPPRARRAARGGSLSVRRVRSPGDLATARALLEEYRDWMLEHREVTAFGDRILARGIARMNREIAALPGDFGPPHGALFIARRGRLPVGCGGLRRWRGRTAEIKRVFVRPAHRGEGAGARLTTALLQHARTLGYLRVRLDTLPRMYSAIRLYRRLGFRQIPPYWDHPLDDALFFEYRWDRPATPAARPSAGRSRNRRSLGGPAGRT